MNDYISYLNALQSTEYANQIGQIKAQIDEAKAEKYGNLGELLTMEGGGGLASKGFETVKSMISSKINDGVYALKEQGQQALEDVVNNVKSQVSGVAEDLMNNAQETVNSLVSQGQETVNSLVSQGQETVNSLVSQGQETVNSLVSQGQETVNSLVGQGESTINSLVNQGQSIGEQLLGQGDGILSQGRSALSSLLSSVDENGSSLGLQSLSSLKSSIFRPTNMEFNDPTAFRGDSEFGLESLQELRPLRQWREISQPIERPLNIAPRQQPTANPNEIEMQDFASPQSSMNITPQTTEGIQTNQAEQVDISASNNSVSTTPEIASDAGGDVAGDITGNVVGDVAGDVAGAVGDVAGEAITGGLSILSDVVAPFLGPVGLIGALIGGVASIFESQKDEEQAQQESAPTLNPSTQFL